MQISQTVSSQQHHLGHFIRILLTKSYQNLFEHVGVPNWSKSNKSAATAGQRNLDNILLSTSLQF